MLSFDQQLRGRWDSDVKGPWAEQAVTGTAATITGLAAGQAYEVECGEDLYMIDCASSAAAAAVTITTATLIPGNWRRRVIEVIGGYLRVKTRDGISSVLRYRSIGNI